MEVTVVLSVPEHHKTSHMPYAIRQMHYGNDNLSGMISMSGYPNNGGQHTCTIWGDRADVVAWLDLFLEEYPDTKPEIDIIKRTIRREFINSPLTHRLKVDLREFTRQHVYKGQFISRKWFWHPKCEPDYVEE